jgi:hypothetical protein
MIDEARLIRVLDAVLSQNAGRRKRRESTRFREVPAINADGKEKCKRRLVSKTKDEPTGSKLPLPVQST